jgi:uncharacterized membrane protein YhfC
MLIAAFVVVFLFEFLFPLGIGLFLKEKFGAKWKLWFFGAAAFIASQVVHLPMLYGWQRLLIAWGVDKIEEPSLLLTAGLVLAVSFMAGLCEEPARWLAYKLLKTEGEPSRHALMLGAGHGGIESMLVGLSVMSSAITVMMMQSGTLPLDQLMPEQLAALSQLDGLAWYLPLWGGFERLLAITLHISLSVIVWLGVRDKKIGNLFIAMGLHTLFNFVGVFAAQLQLPYWAIEGSMALIAVPLVFVVIRLMRNNGMMTLYAPEKLDDEEEFSGLFAEQFREAGFGGVLEKEPNEPDSGRADE